MAVLGEAIELDTLVSGARDIAVVASLWSDEFSRDPLTIEQMRYDLERHADHLLPIQRPIFAFGEYFLGMGDELESQYTDPLRAEGAGVVGHYSGICAVQLEQQVEVGTNVHTCVVPALEITPKDVQLEGDVSLGIGQLYPRVAVPLLGQTAVVFWCEGIRFPNAN